MRLLVIGNKKYSSWSLRPWLLMRHFEVAFEERLLPLDTPEFSAEIGQLSPSRRVPVLHDDGLVVWDSLAICEYVNEAMLDGRGWPQHQRPRALARAASAEMHSGFAALRSQLPMLCGRQPDAYRWDAAAQADIDRVLALWGELRALHADAGNFLCGRFGIVDAMFAPVAIRLRGYGATLDPVSTAYIDALMALPAMQAWITSGVAEAGQIGKYEQLRSG